MPNELLNVPDNTGLNLTPEQAAEADRLRARDGDVYFIRNAAGVVTEVIAAGRVKHTAGRRKHAIAAAEPGPFNPAYENLRAELLEDVATHLMNVCDLLALIRLDASELDRAEAQTALRNCADIGLAADRLDEFIHAREARRAAAVTDDPGPDVADLS